MKNLLVLYVLGLIALCSAQASLVGLEDENAKPRESAPPSFSDETEPTLLDLTTNAAITNTEPENNTIQPAPTESKRTLYISIAIGTFSIVSLLLTIPTCIRIRHEQRLNYIEPESWDEIQTIVHSTMHRFAKKMHGQNFFSTKLKYALLASDCGRQWMISDQQNLMVGRTALLICINRACTHFEVHHNEMRHDPIRTENLSAPALLNALATAHSRGPFRLARAPHGNWADISQR